MPEPTARDIFAGMKDNFDASKAAGVAAAIAYRLSGENGGAWTLRVRGGELQVDEGLPSGAVNATVSMSADDFVRVATGGLNPMTAFMAGRIKIDGDPFIAQKFQSFFREPR